MYNLDIFWGHWGSPSMLSHPFLIHSSAPPHCPGRSSSNSSELFAEKNVCCALGLQDPSMWTVGLCFTSTLGSCPGHTAVVEASGFFQEEEWKILNTDKSPPRDSPSHSGCYNSPFYLAGGFRASFCLSVCPGAEGHRQMSNHWAVLLPRCRPHPPSGGTSLKPYADFRFFSCQIAQEPAKHTDAES